MSYFVIIQRRNRLPGSSASYSHLTLRMSPTPSRVSTALLPADSAVPARAHPHLPFSMDPGSSPTVAHSYLPRPYRNVPAQQAQDGLVPTTLLLVVKLVPRTVLSGQHVAISPFVRTLLASKVLV